jgi:hypothetical protein
MTFTLSNGTKVDIGLDLAKDSLTLMFDDGREQGKVLIPLADVADLAGKIRDVAPLLSRLTKPKE